MEKKAGTELVTGIAQVPGMVAQTGSKAAGGELKVYRDENGQTLAIYLDDDHSEVQFEGLLKLADIGGSVDKKIGDSFTAFGVAGYLTAWKVDWSNDDVAKVSGSLRDYTIASSTPASTQSSAPTSS